MGMWKCLWKLILRNFLIIGIPVQKIILTGCCMKILLWKRLWSSWIRNKPIKIRQPWIFRIFWIPVCITAHSNCLFSLPAKAKKTFKKAWKGCVREGKTFPKKGGCQWPLICKRAFAFSLLTCFIIDPSVLFKRSLKKQTRLPPSFSFPEKESKRFGKGYAREGKNLS